jgi:hypothetical protein
MISFEHLIVQENISESFTSIQKQHYRILFLVIASKSEVYDSFLRGWREIMKDSVFQSNIRCFFVFSDPLISCDLLVSEDTITYKCEESLRPGIFLKTTAALWYCDQHFDYDFLIRTNLSSFFHVPELLDFLQEKPLSSVIYTPVQLILKNHSHINSLWGSYWEKIELYFSKDLIEKLGDMFPFLDGACFIWSRDIVTIFLEEIVTDTVFKNQNGTEIDFFSIPDDVLISILLIRIIHDKKKNYEFSNIFDSIFICNQFVSPLDIPEHVFFIRNRTDFIFGNRNIDILNFVNQIRYFYCRYSFLL